MKLFGIKIGGNTPAPPRNYVEVEADEKIGAFTVQYTPTTITPAKADDYRNAIQAARADYSQHRSMLYDKFQNAIDFDAHLRGLIEKRIIATTGKKLEFRVGEKPSEKAEALMRSPKWDEFLHAIIYYRVFWGLGLLEVGKRKWHDQELFDFGIVPPKHIDPYQKFVRHYAFGKSDKDKPYDKVKTAIQLGEKDNLGLLLQLALVALYKRALMNNWAKYAEKAGNNFETVKYQGAQPDPQERGRILKKLANRSGDDVTDLPQGVAHEVTNMSSTSQNQLFENQYQALNDEMTKLVLGQTMTTEDGASRSQAEVHERTQNSIFDADAKNLLDVLNYDFVDIAVDLFGLEPGGEFVYVENTYGQTLDAIEQDMKLKELVQVDPDYFYEKYDIPKPEKQAASNLASVLGVGALQSLQNIVTDPTLTAEQKRNMLIIIFGIDEESATRMTTTESE